MVNPGSPEAMRQAQMEQSVQPMPKGTMIGMLITLIVMMIIVQWRTQIGQALDLLFHPVGFVDMPVVTLVLAGLLMITFSTIVRGILTDPLEQARNQHIQSEFNAEMRQARAENNLFKLKKLQEIQPQVMAKSMEASTKQMKTMPITMIFTLPMYAWVFYFVSVVLGGDANNPGPVYIDVPWGSLNLNDRALNFMPYWIVIYTMISLPIGQLENRFVRFFLMKKRLKELEAVY